MDEGVDAPEPGDQSDSPVTDDGANVGHAKSFGRLLYNHNPFYLLSCLLVIYGCQGFAISSGDLYEKSISMAGGIAAYTLLMALVCVGVVRLAKVWEDARSIFIVVLVSLVALTTGFDELCIGDRSLAIVFASAAALVTVVTVEAMLWMCRIRLGFWYRFSLYAHFAALIGFPVMLGRAVAERNDPLANWGSFLFSMAVAGAMLLIVPALRKGPASVKDSGTPWKWPYYPLSAFLVLLVLCVLRSHAIWMSFGFYGTAGRFEPFLLLPMFAALLILVVESALSRNDQSLVRTILFATPVLLVCGMTRGGATWLPIGWDLKNLFGSSLTVSLIAVAFVYLWMSLRGVKLASIGLVSTVAVAGFLAPIPETTRVIGLDSWMLELVAGVLFLFFAIRSPRTDWLWAVTALIGAITIAMAGDAAGHTTYGRIAAGVFATLAMLVIGALFSTPLAILLRYQAAVTMTVAAVLILVRSLRTSDERLLFAVLLIAGVSLGYGLWIHRRSWLAIAAIQTLIFCGAFVFHGYESGRLRRVNWPITSGMICLIVGVAITASKTGAHRRLMERRAKKVPGSLTGL